MIQKTVEAANKDAQEKIKATGIGTQSNDEVNKLIVQQQYGLQIVHTRQQEFEYAVKTAAADERALADRGLQSAGAEGLSGAERSSWGKDAQFRIAVRH